MNLAVPVRAGRLRTLVDMRCAVCNRVLLKIDDDALQPGKVLEIKCRCDAMNYRKGRTTEARATT